MKFNSVLASAGLASLVSGAALQTSQPKSYQGYKVVRLAVGNNVAKMNSIIEKLDLATWMGPPKAGRNADIVVPPAQVAAFDAAVAGMDTTVMHEDLGLSIDEQTSFNTYAAGSVNQTWFNSYHSYADHTQFLNDLQSSYPGQSAVITAGNSLEGRPIRGIHFWGSGGKGKPAVVFHGTVHAREWISTMVVEYFAWYMLTNSASTEVKGFLDKYDMIFFPVVNPDGFVYTQTNDRLWRKNRQSTSGSSCIGHDINRNWDYKWSVSGGASTSPCAQDFKGPSAASAPETKALSAWIKATKASQGVKLFIDWHAYSQLFMTPYGYSCTALVTKNTEYQSLAKGAAAAMKALFGTTFKTGPICSTIYPATGSSVDYAQDVVNSDYVFTVELRDTGNYGFVLPATQILPSGQEAYAGVKYLLQNMK